MSSEQLDFFDAPLPARVEVIYMRQALKLWGRVYWQRKKMYRNTVTFLRYIDTYFEGRLVHRISKIEIECLVDDLSKGRVRGQGGPLGISGQNKVLTILRLLYDFLLDLKEGGFFEDHDFSPLQLPMRNPARRVRSRREPKDDRFFSPWEFRTWIRICRQMGDEELGRIIKLGIWLRLSPIDLIELNDDEIDEPNMIIRVYRRHTKTDRNPQGVLQVIPMTEKLWGFIQTCRRYRWPGQKKILVVRNLRKRLRALRDEYSRQGGRDFTLRHLRRSGAGRLHELGVDVETIAAGLAHTDTRVTKRHYLPATNPALKDSVAKLEKEYSS